jgi:hypothetical protein
MTQVGRHRERLAEDADLDERLGREGEGEERLVTLNVACSSRSQARRLGAAPGMPRMRCSRIAAAQHLRDRPQLRRGVGGQGAGHQQRDGRLDGPRPNGTLLPGFTSCHARQLRPPVEASSPKK